MPMPESETGPAPEIVAETLALNRVLEELLGEGVARLRDVGRAKRAVANAFVRKGIGMTIEELHAETLEATGMLEDLAHGRVEFRAVRARLVRYSGILKQAFAWIDRLASPGSREAADAAEAAAAAGAGQAPDAEANAAALERLREARGLVPALQRMTG